MKKIRVGGQAVVEGVMMKANRDYATAVRLEDGSIKVKKSKTKFADSKIPFIRGVVNLIQILHIGVKSLNWSASQAMGEEEQSGIWSAITILLSVVFGLALFKLLPLFVADSFNPDNYFFYNLIDGGVKFLIFAGYIFLISRMKEIKRVFEYHGAEHKVVNCFESGKKLTVNNCKKFTRIHKRCGTTFIFLVLLFSIVVYLFIPEGFSFWEKLGLRVLLLPVIASLAYEFIALAARFNNQLFKVIMLPGLLIQKMSTREPSKDQIEVAIKALKTVLKKPSTKKFGDKNEIKSK